MADLVTKISDLITPEIFSPYLIEETIHKNAFINSGIATSDESVSLNEGGTTVNIPFFKQADVDAEILADTGDGLETHNITADKSVAVVHAQGFGFAVNDLAKQFSGADPLAAIASMLGGNWARNQQKTAIASLEGCMSIDAMKDSVNDQSTAVLTADMMADSMFLLGDNFSKISCVAMSSAVLAKLKKLELVDWVQPSEMPLGYYTYMEKRVIIDDALADAEGVYPIYFFGEGALSYNESNIIPSVEYTRNAKKGQDEIYTRRVYTMHPRGMKWVGTPAGLTPTAAELKATANWELAAERKNVAISLLKAKLA